MLDTPSYGDLKKQVEALTAELGRERERLQISLKRDEKEREKLQTRLAEALEMAHLGPWEYDVINDVFTFNDQFYKIYHTTAEKVGGYTMSAMEYASRFVHPDDFHLVGEEIKKVLETDDPSFSEDLEHRIIYADGTVGYITVRFFIVMDHTGKTIKTYGVNQDITERKHAEEKLRENEEKLARLKKMESLGILAGGVAHDLNNILSGIINYPELILIDLPEDSPLRQPIEKIKECGNRMAAVVQDLLSMARGVAVERQTLNLNHVVSDYLRSTEHKKLLQLHPTVHVKADMDSRLLNIKGSPIHITKAVMNLASNAAEAVVGHGQVTLSTTNRYIDRPLKGYDEVNVGEYAVLTVADNGPGIFSDDLEKIFEPFYTKKVMGRSGTGLGLTVVWNVMQDHNGYIHVSTDENGSTFELYFPITRDEIWEKDKPVSINEYLGNGEKILVVDDVENQRVICCKMLDLLGYQPVAMSSGEAAVDYLKDHCVDLVLLDMIMDPGINGRETYERIIKLHPGQKAVIVSGFAATDEVLETQRLGAGRYIKKPVQLEKLGIAIREELDQSPPS